MKIYKAIFLFFVNIAFGLAMIFLLALPTHAETRYSRSPSGSAIISPVSFDVSFDDFINDTGVNGISDYWNIIVESGEGDFYGECLSKNIHSNIFSLSLPIHDYYGVFFRGYATLGNCQSNTNYLGDGFYIEGDGFSVIFSVINPPPPPPPPPAGTSWAVSTSTTALIVQNLTDQLSDNGTLIFLVMIGGLITAFGVIEYILDTFPG